MDTDAKNIELAAQLMHDQSFRHKVRNKDPDALAQIGFEFSEDASELKVVSSTKHKTYVPFPLLPDNHRISNAELGQIQATVKVGSASTLITVGSAGTACSSVSTIGTAGTVASAGSAV